MPFLYRWTRHTGVQGRCVRCGQVLPQDGPVCVKSHQVTGEQEMTFLGDLPESTDCHAMEA